MPTQTRAHSIHVRDETNKWVPREYQAKNNLFNETTFYTHFTKDVLAAKREVIIYSPFVSKYRSNTFNRVVYKLSETNVNLFIFTRPVDEYDRDQQSQIKKVLDRYTELGANVFYLKGSIHEKIAIIDREILWEGSLNILSQRTSREMMRRITDEDSAAQVMRYLGLNPLLAEGYKQKYERLYRSLMESKTQKRHISLKSIITGLIALGVIWWILTALLGMIPMDGATTLLVISQILLPF